MFWAYREDAMELYYAFRWATMHSLEDWLDRLAMLGIIEEEDYHREVGKIFSIPKCCREWFIYLMCGLKVENALLETDGLYGKDNLQEKFCYVRCPYCRNVRDGRTVNE